MSRLDVFPLPELDATGGRVIITSPYGPRWGSVHQGVDLGTTDGIEAGTTCHAPADGTLVHSQHDGPAPSAGLNLWFQADDGRRWKFFHLSAVTIPAGTHVRAGQVIARVGMTGTSAPHLHLEEHVGSWSNPVDLTADVRECLNARRFPGSPTPTPEPVPPAPPVVTMPAPICKFPAPATALFFGWMNGRLPAWQHIPDPATLDELHAAGVVDKNDVRLFASGNDALDRAWAEWDKSLLPEGLR